MNQSGEARLGVFDVMPPRFGQNEGRYALSQSCDDLPVGVLFPTKYSDQESDVKLAQLLHGQGTGATAFNASVIATPRVPKDVLTVQFDTAIVRAKNALNFFRPEN